MDNTEVARAEIVILAVKPMFYESVIGEIRPVVTKEQIFISIAPGKTLRWLADQFGSSDFKIVRTMPNTPALVGEGITGVTPCEGMDDKDIQTVLTILESFGKAEVIDEHLMDVVVSVSGSSPAYVFMFIEAMADAAVADGMPRAQAYTFAAQSVLGSAKMVLETGMHPAQLKDMVCSPGGTTIEAVRVLEEKGMRSCVIEAMKACTQKAKDC
jgi:pyrroline-5-carboxylate reductase